MTTDLPMSEFVKHTLYEDLIKMPLWVVAAFSNRGLSEFYLDEIRVQLIAHLVIKVMDRCPGTIYNNDYRHDWKTKDIVPVVKDAYEACLRIATNTPHISYTMAS